MFKQNTHATKLARAYHTLQQTWSIYVVVGSLLLSAAPVFLAGFQPENDPPWPTTIAFSARPLNTPYKQVG